MLDIDSKAWEKMFFDEKYTAHAGADFGMNLTETDPTEQEARRVPLEMFYKGMGLVGLVYGKWYEAQVKIEYQYGKLKSTVPEKIARKKIKRVHSNGGWSLMDYWIET